MTPRLRRFLARLVIVATLGYAGVVGYLVSQETQLVFVHGRPLGTGRPSAPYEQISLASRPDQQTFAWQMPAVASSPHPLWMLYLHGNAATVANRANLVRYEALRQLGAHVLAVEYRGFGGVDGTPSEVEVTADARAAYDYLREVRTVPPDQIVIFGWSLGSAVAVNLASEVPSGGVILEGAPASVVAIGQRNYPWIPVRLVMRNPFDSILKVGRIRAPMLFLHSPEDEVIPIAEGRRLFAAANEPKQFVEVSGGHIRPAEEDRARYFAAVAAFLARLPVTGAAHRP